ALGPRYEVRESSSAAAARPTGGLREDYGRQGDYAGSRERCRLWDHRHLV
ncbi:hypothetical protein Tco_0696426, partial [Tanacetum coccineum]